MKHLFLAAISAAAILVADTPSARADTILDINFDGPPYGGHGTPIQDVADPYGTWSANPWTIDTNNSRGGTASARQSADPRVFVDYRPSDATKQSIISSTSPLLVEWSFYRPTTTAEVRLIVKGGIHGTANTDLWQLNLQADGNVRFESTDTLTSDIYNVTPSLIGWWDFRLTMDLTTGFPHQITSVMVREPGAASFSEVLSQTRFFKNDGSYLNLLRWDGNNEGATADTAYDSIRISEEGSTFLPGDFNGDGNVDAADLDLWKMHFPLANGATRETGDADADGDTDGADFLVWQTNLFISPPAIGVPEPSTAVLAVSIVLLIGSCSKIRVV